MSKQTEALKLALEALEKCRAGFEYTRQYVGYETLPAIDGWSWYDGDVAATKAITAIREALAEQPAQEPVCAHGIEKTKCGFCQEPTQQQEPVAYSYTSRITLAQGFSHHPMPRFIDSESWDINPLYTSPPASKPWVGLTDEDVYPLANAHLRHQPESYEVSGIYDLARAIEAKLREKNA